MAVITALQKTHGDSKGELTAKKHTKIHLKTRPITATLDHPLILDIKLLKRLDMTTFTKKGLIALSKFCGISLINKTETKKKLNKCVKTIQYSKKVEGNDHSFGLIPECKSHRAKRKLGKQITKAKPRIRFKLPKEETSPDEDSLDVVCKKHNKALKTCNKMTNDKSPGRKSVLDNILHNTIENIVPEPCKTCSRSQHPERFHSHPKVVMRLSLEEQTNEKNLEERFKNAVTTKDEKEKMKKSLCAKDSEGKSLQDPCVESESKPCSKSPSGSLVGLSSPEESTKLKSKTVRKPSTSSLTNTKSKEEIPKKTNSKLGPSQPEESKTTPSDEDLSFVTGCYICGKQVSPKMRIQHEKTCILEWRTQNSLISPDQRKPEPKRPDYRFTSSGSVDFEGTFESIWANHMDSLVPCKKCGRKFFPDRIEKHENCCSNVPITIKYKH